jgi:hypothetical protein
METESRAGWMFKFRDGRVLIFRAFREPERVFEAIGLSEQATPSSPAAGRPPNGRYWARTSDPQLVELVLSQLS